jgi:formate/nitrite transporter
MLAGAFIGFRRGVLVRGDGRGRPRPGLWSAARAGRHAAFALGLILVVVGGAELFTGNALMVMAAVDRRITLGGASAELGDRLCRQSGRARSGWRLAFGLSGLLDGPMGAVAAKAATAKAGLPPLEAFVRGALCNALVCLAVWLSFAARTATDKILGVLWPVAAFVTLGLEHSVANMFLFPAGLWAGAEAPLAGVAGNLFWVTLGNVIGGAGGVALAYRFAYGAMRG